MLLTFHVCLILTVYFTALGEKNVFASGSSQCQEPLNDDDVLCNTQNVTQLKCYINRVLYTKSDFGLSWVSVCVFKHNLINHASMHSYNCRLLNESQPVICELKNNPSTKVFNAPCSFTFYRTTVMNYDDFPGASEGQLCPKLRDECPPSNFQRLNKVYVPIEGSNQFRNYSYGDLNSFTVRSSTVCLGVGLVAAIVIISIIILILVGILTLYMVVKIRKFIKSTEESSDALIAMIDIIKNPTEPWNQDSSEEEDYCQFTPSMIVIPTNDISDKTVVEKSSAVNEIYQFLRSEPHNAEAIMPDTDGCLSPDKKVTYFKLADKYSLSPEENLEYGNRYGSSNVIATESLPCAQSVSPSANDKSKLILLKNPTYIAESTLANAAIK